MYMQLGMHTHIPHICTLQSLSHTLSKTNASNPAMNAAQAVVTCTHLTNSSDDQPSMTMYMQTAIVSTE
jgi:hypothetical protein